ncbi:MAG: type III secretion system export apparatus subunit SctT [Janthinobacterium lividum]
MPLLETPVAWMSAWVLACVRLLACWSIVPVFGRQLLPGLLRAAVALALSLGYVPLMHAALATATPFEWLLMLVREVCVGLCVGVCVAVVFWSVEGVAALVDAQSGAQAGAILNPLSANEEGVFAGLMYWAFVAYFFSVGGLRWVAAIIAESYRVWPPGIWYPTLPLPSSAAGVNWWLRLFDGLSAAVVTLAAPLLVAMLIVELSLGLVGRFTPQLQVFFIAMPLKLVTALLVLGMQVSSIFIALGPVGPIADSDGAQQWIDRIKGGIGGGEDRTAH